MDEFDHKQREKMEAHLRKKQETAKIIKQQLYEFKMKYIKRLKDQMLEGELVKRQTQIDFELDRKREMERKEIQAKMREEFRKANEDLERYKVEMKRKEREEEERLKKYAE